MQPHEPNHWRLARRHFLRECRVGLGAMALGGLLERDGLTSAGERSVTDPLSLQQPHMKPRAKSVIFLFMAGGPSQLELFDYKPRLQALTGQPVPPSLLKGKRFSFIGKDAKLMGTSRPFARHGDSGQQISACLPHVASMADEIAIVRGMTTDVFNHGPAKYLTSTGFPRLGFPSMGAWVTYGIGSESDNLPGFVVLQSGPRGPRGGSPLWGSGFLPTAYQGVPFRSQGDPVTNLASPPGIDRRRQRDFVDAVNALNRLHYQQVGDAEIQTRIAAYEMGFRMQQSAPELIDLSGESRDTLALYGAEPNQPSFANNCLLARRLVERGVRFVQLFHTDWDHHGGPQTELQNSLDKVCQDVDRPSMALVQDLKQRGLLDETLVVWGGEFGRTPQGEARAHLGRDHHIDAYSMWLAGGGIRAGITLGKTDDLGFHVVEDRVHVHDLQATILHLVGLDHLQLTYRYQGRDFRLTDVGGDVVSKLLA